MAAFSPDVLAEAQRRGVHPGAVAFEQEQARQARYRNISDPAQYAQVLASDPVLGNSQSTQALLRDYQANPGGYEMRGGRLVKRKNRFLNALQNPYIAIPAVIGAAAAPAVLGAIGGGGGGAAAAGAAGTGGSTAASVAGAAGAAGGSGMEFGLSSLIGSLIQGGTSLLGGAMQSNAMGNAAEIQARANAEAQARLLAQVERENAQYLEERAREWGIDDTARSRQYGREDARNTRLQPYWNNNAQGYRTLSGLLMGPSSQVAPVQPGVIAAGSREAMTSAPPMAGGYQVNPQMASAVSRGQLADLLTMQPQPVASTPALGGIRPDVTLAAWRGGR